MIAATFIFILISLLFSPIWSETKEDLVERDGYFYKKFNDVPFSGKLNGIWNGKIKDGRRIGLWKEYHENGQIKSKGKYISGKKEGYWENYHENGQIKSKVNFKNDYEDGVFNSFFSNGVAEDIGNYVEGNKQGIWTSIKIENDSYYRDTVHYVDGNKNGMREQYYLNGQLRFRGVYENGNLTDGTYQFYHQNGFVWASGEYKDGERHGPWKLFSEVDGSYQTTRNY